MTLAIVPLVGQPDLSTACPLYAAIRSDRVPNSYDIAGSALYFSGQVHEIEMPSSKKPGSWWLVTSCSIVTGMAVRPEFHQAPVPSSGLPIRKTARRAGNVALNISALEAALVGIVGDDEPGEELPALTAAGVLCDFFKCGDKPTITKRG